MAYLTLTNVQTSAWAPIQPGNTTSTYAIVSGIISELRTKIQPGNKILFDDINKVKTLLDYIKFHTHTFNDYDAIAEFGNNGVRTIGPTLNTVTYGVNSGGSFSPNINQNYPAGFVTGGTIYAAHHNQFAANYNMLNGHWHNFYDSYYP
jgi:hypothetical protein